jgi:hypothetical protein
VDMALSIAAATAIFRFKAEMSPHGRDAVVAEFGNAELPQMTGQRAPRRSVGRRASVIPWSIRTRGVFPRVPPRTSLV